MVPAASGAPAFPDPPAEPANDKEREDALKNEIPDVTYLTLQELIAPTLQTELSRSVTRARVQQYQRYFEDVDRVLILLHNEPDPDAMASGLALRTLLRRTKTTAILGALQGVVNLPRNAEKIRAALDQSPIGSDS